MDPLTNAVLGVVFLGVGAIATIVMYSLRGSLPTAEKPQTRLAETPASRSHERVAGKKTTQPLIGPKSAQAAASATSTSTPSRVIDSGPKGETETKWYKVAEPDEVREGTVVAADTGNRAIALTVIQGEFGAVDGHCPHQGGPLTEGILKDGILRCPWHGWGFDPRTGKSADPHHGDVPAYKVEAREDGVFVAVEEENRSEPTVSDVMVETMVNWGVKHVFGMVGHSNLGLSEAVRKQEDKGNLRFIGIRHEGAASFACSAYAKLTGHPAACLTIAGPGATNLLTGLWDAHVDRAPVLALTGQVNTQVLGPGAFQEIDQASAFRAVSAWSQTVLTTSNHAELMTLALKHATIERGVAHLIFPDEVQVLTSTDLTASSWEGRLSDVDITPSAESIDQAVALIAHARRPVIIVGHGARESMEEVIHLGERLNAPILTTFKGKGQINDQHPLAGGVLGRSGTPIAGSMMSQSDLLIVFGASFAAHTGIDRSKPIIQVDFDRMALGKFHPVTVPVWGEIALTANLLSQQLPAELRAIDTRNELAQQWSSWRDEKRKRAARDRGNGLNSAAIFAALTRLAPPDAVIPVDVGNNTYSFGRYFECTAQTILMSGYLGSIGFSLPAALGARMARPDRPTISVSGDGGFGQYMAEFTTAVKYDMNITHVLLNNNELGKISLEQRAGQWPVWQTSLQNPNFADYARLCGGYGVRVTEIGELDQAISDAIQHNGPGLVEIMSDAELT